MQSQARLFLISNSLKRPFFQLKLFMDKREGGGVEMAMKKDKVHTLPHSANR